ncbi:carbohydrate kinase family protein [Georgenia thermotolerans]|uniref:Carbohydrate kinase n=1 Tax=Georgenia thermotolerans TaxID=527326 RepID=A0A7J5UUI7_9MICO|nr:carbohydrate kinase [Georgenia thermotolerans]KAE8765936.1 carbohydrate kinase [Georgenia thermotolerans]
MTVLVIGEALIDLSEDTRSVPSAVAEHVGGSPANVALGLGRLDVDVDLLTSLAPDERGRRIAAHLEASGVALLAPSWGAARTPTAHAVLRANGAAEYTFDLTWTVPSPLRIEDHPRPEGAELSPAVVHTGSIASFLTPGCEAVLRLLKEARAIGAHVTYDPNVRPALIEGEAVARDRILAAAALADVVKLSDEDAAWLFGCEVEESVRALLDLGPQLVVVTVGAEGSMLATRTEWADVPSTRVEVIDTIGAGDSYMAALIAELLDRVVERHRRAGDLERWELAEIGARCAAAAAITVSRAGANPPTRDELDAAVREAAEGA